MLGIERQTWSDPDFSDLTNKMTMIRWCKTEIKVNPKVSYISAGFMITLRDYTEEEGGGETEAWIEDVEFELSFER